MILTSVLSSCLYWPTTPVTEQSGKLVSSDRIYQPSFVGTAQNKNEATVAFYRDASFLGSGCSHYIYIDDVKVFAIWQGEKMTLHMPSGNHVFRLQIADKDSEKEENNLCPNDTISEEITLEPSGHQAYRIFHVNQKFILTRLK